MPWPVLAGIGKLECDHSCSPDPACRQEGAVNYAGAARSRYAALCLLNEPGSQKLHAQLGMIGTFDVT